MTALSMLAALVLSGLGCSGPARPQRRVGQPGAVSRVTLAFDRDWRFLKADPCDAQRPEFDDTGWRTLDVPHDWSIEGPFDANNTTAGAGGFLPGGVGWYRKHFTLPAEYRRRRVFVEFDGVMANSQVWVNGTALGQRPYGYVSFRYELTGSLGFGENQLNVLAVRADNSRQPASRWYTGGGIYRHVRLIAVDPVHLAEWATFVTTPQVAEDRALVHVRTSVVNQSDLAKDVTVVITLQGPDGRVAGEAETGPQAVAAGQSADFQQDLPVPAPVLWDLDRPSLYRAIVQVRSKGASLDNEEVAFGIRQFEFRRDTGFWLNGKSFKLKGVCLHHDAGGFGAAVPLAVWERRLTALKRLGANAVRTAHNPVAPEFLDLCDRMGVLVMDEFFDCWTVAKNPYDYHLFFNEWSKRDLADTIRRDRNHPSIILYSVGNEIHDTPKAELARGILEGLVAVCHENDPTRPVTQGLFRPNVSRDYDNGLADLLDVIGTNYRDRELLAAWQAKPGRKIVGTEQRHDRDTWLACRDNPQHAGQFLWSGVDYLGEARNWPLVAAGSGLLDRTGVPKPMAYERQSWWLDRPMVHVVRRVGRNGATPADPGFEPLASRQVLFDDWTPSNRGPHDEEVEVYSNCPQVELLLNGRSLGSKDRNADDSARNWQVAFEPGTLRAVASSGDRVLATYELQTAGETSKILLTAERTTIAPVWDDALVVEATVVDANGVRVPSANDLITFKVTGQGVLAAVDSGSLTSHEPFQAGQRHAFQGRCVAALKATGYAGRITLTAEAAGLTGSSITIETAQQAR
jgi:beta-galactosidase